MTSSLYFLPPRSSPPWALISSKISSVAFLCGMPQGAAGPESGVETPNLMTSCAWECAAPNAMSPATVSNAAQIISSLLDSVLGSEGVGTRTIGTSIAPCQWGTAVRVSRRRGSPVQWLKGLDYTHAHVDARESDPVSEISEGPGRRARPGRGAPVRSGGGARPQRTLREPGHPDPLTVTPGSFGLSVQRGLSGRGRRARPGERSRAEPSPALPPRLGSAGAATAVTPSAAIAVAANAATAKRPAPSPR